MIVSVILAKKNSQRLKNKNILDFCGLPLVEWSIIQSTCSHGIDKTFVSTNSNEIASLAEKHDAGVVWRDYDEHPNAKAAVPLWHALKIIRKEYPLSEYVFVLLPTAPLRKIDDLDNIAKRFLYLRKTKNITRIDTASPQLETFLRRKVGDMSETVYIDKYSNGLIMAWLCTPLVIDEILREEKENDSPLTDSEIDMKYHNNRMYNYPGATKTRNAIYNGKRYYYECEIWQTLDIDNQEIFDLAKIYMDFYILKGRGPEIYFDYRDNK